MSWNKPSSAPQPTPKKSAPPSLKRGLLAGLVVVALGALGLYLFSSGEATSPSLQKKDRGLIKEVTPAAAPTNRVRIVEEKIPYWEVDASQTNGFTKEMMLKWNYRHVPPPKHVYRLQRKKSKWHIFEHASENRVASLLCARPGDHKIGHIEVTPELERDFLESFKTPIIPTAEDDEFTASLKRQMNQVKADLKARIDNGESFAKIIEDTEDEMRKLSMYKQDLLRELDALIKDGAQTEEDVLTFKEATNKMLEEKGIAPIEFTDITEERLLNMKGTDEL